MAPTPAVQRLYDVCKKAFTSLGVPAESQVQSVRSILGAYMLLSLAAATTAVKNSSASGRGQVVRAFCLDQLRAVL